MLELNKIYNMDCVKGMKQFPDKYFDLAICDPPYGGGAAGTETELQGGYADYESKKRGKIDRRFDKYHIESKEINVVRNGTGRWEKYGNKISHWDIAPNDEYFTELARVSKNQIIWGGNYFDLPPTRCFLIWKKAIPEKFSMAMCEYAWTSFNANAKVFEYASQAKKGESRFHPTQKPIELYEWQLKNYAKPGDKILSTHGGSCPEMIAAHNMGMDCISFEVDEHYYKLAVERLEAVKAQVRFAI